MHDGLQELVDVINSSLGNTLAVRPQSFVQMPAVNDIIQVCTDGYAKSYGA
jgi:hypothetical protein